MQTDNSGNVIVFLGPTLSVEEGKQILPNAIFLPPVQCGDIFRCLLLKPKKIIIIDGYFEQVPSVWHKEILYALERGSEVYGASSMGALRAVELADHGMIGVGEIFNSFYSGELRDDDEVAILHGQGAQEYKPLSEAMVNIRATMFKALQEGVITERLSNVMINTAKKTYYKNRTYKSTIQDTIDVNPEEKSNLVAFIKWIEDGKAINQKKLDATTLLKIIANDDKNNVIKYAKPTPKTFYLRTLEKVVMAEHLVTGMYDTLGQNQIEILAKQPRGGFNVYALRLAHLFILIMKYSYSQHVDKIGDILTHINELKVNKNLVNETLVLLFKESGYYGLCHIDLGSKDDKELLNLLKSETTAQYHILRYTAICWLYLTDKLPQSDVDINPVVLQKYSDQFRRKKKILKKEDTMNWMMKYGFNKDSYQLLMEILATIEYVGVQNNTDILAETFNQTMSHQVMDITSIKDILDEKMEC